MHAARSHTSHLSIVEKIHFKKYVVFQKMFLELKKTFLKHAYLKHIRDVHHYFSQKTFSGLRGYGCVEWFKFNDDGKKTWYIVREKNINNFDIKAVEIYCFCSSCNFCLWSQSDRSITGYRACDLIIDHNCFCAFHFQDFYHRAEAKNIFLWKSRFHSVLLGGPWMSTHPHLAWLAMSIFRRHIKCQSMNSA